MLTLILILLPLAFLPILFFLKGEKTIRIVAMTGAMAEFGIAVAALVQYLTTCHCNLTFYSDWLSTLGVSLVFKMDGITLPLVLLTALLVPIIMVSTFNHHYSRTASFYALMLLMESALMGVFTTSDGLIFYIFWELTLIPAWFICAAWGGNDRIRITFKFFVYTFTGSLLMLVALIYIYFRTPLPHAFDFRVLYLAVLTPGEQFWLFLAFFVAFAIKIPLFPFHTWQPDTYTESPAAGSMLLAGIMLKMGIYGVIRLLIPICHSAMDEMGGIAMILSVTGIVYGSLIAIRQEDLKRLVAYSSIAHVGLIAAGVFVLNLKGLQGSVIQMVSHGINIVGLFFIIDIIQQRTGSRNISDLGGIARKAPRLAIFFMIILLGSIALPLTNGFVGEFLLLIGLFEYNPVFAAVAGLTIIFSAVYMLWMYQRVMYGSTTAITENIKDLSGTEMAALFPLIVVIFWIGIAPGFFMDLIWPEAMRLLTLYR